MYIKFCRGYGQDKKDDFKKNLASALSVQLEDERDKQQDKTEGNGRLYRLGCLILTLICLVLLLVVIVLCVKLQAGSTVCPESLGKATDRAESYSLSPTCSCKSCPTHYTNIQDKHLGCQQCANGWLTYGRSCFYLSTFRLSWDKSQRNCTARGGSLAVITNQSVQNFLTKEGKLNYWVGLRRDGQKWTWVNGTELQQRYWAEKEEESSGDDCGILASSSPPERNWMRASCHAYTYFICHVQF